MKFITALVIATSLFLGGALPALASGTLTTPNTCVNVPDAALGSLATAVENTAHPAQLPVEVEPSSACR